MRQSREERNQVCNGSHLCLQTRLAAWIWQGGFGEVDLTKWIWWIPQKNPARAGRDWLNY